MRIRISRFLIILTILFIGLFFYVWRNRIFSKDVLKLELLGPSEANLAQEVEYIVKYKNNGNFRLEDPELIFIPPENSIKDENLFERQVLTTEQLGGAIYPGEEKSFTFKFRLLGKEEEGKTSQVFLSYQPKNLKARYESSTSFTTLIKSVPLTFEFDLPSKIAAGKDFTFQINYFSNLDYFLTGLRCQVEYPSGFEFLRSSPKSIDKTEWEIPILNKSEGGRIEISGRLLGEIGQARVFRAKLGLWKDGEFILLKEAEKGVEIITPSIFVEQEINGNPQYVASPGDWLHYEIYFKNVGEDEITNLFMINKLEGEAFNFQTMSSDLGSFEPGDNSIVFDWRKVPKLQYLAPMEQGKVDFWIKLNDDLANVKNPTLKNKVFISQVEEEFITKISSKLEIVQKGYFQDEVFGNLGPIPPRVGEATSYTIMWQVKNYYSDVKDVKIKAILPNNIELTGKIFPEDASQKFSFDSLSREIVWSVGDLERGSGVSKSGPSLAFQITLTPKEAQRGTTPEIIGSAKIEAFDTWTQTNIEFSASAINTTLPDDPTVSDSQGIVQ